MIILAMFVEMYTNAHRLIQITPLKKYLIWKRKHVSDYKKYTDLKHFISL